MSAGVAPERTHLAQSNITNLHGFPPEKSSAINMPSLMALSGKFSLTYRVVNRRSQLYRDNLAEGIAAARTTAGATKIVNIYVDDWGGDGYSADDSKASVAWPRPTPSIEY